jgi:hypothetical protein
LYGESAARVHRGRHSLSEAPFCFLMQICLPLSRLSGAQQESKEKRAQMIIAKGAQTLRVSRKPYSIETDGDARADARDRYRDR